MKEFMEYMARHHDDWLKTMTDEQKEIFEKFDNCWSEYTSLAESAIFEYAFKRGARLAIEMQTDAEQQQYRELGIGKIPMPKFFSILANPIIRLELFIKT